MRILCVLAFLCVGLFPSRASAAPERKVLTVENAEGVWFRQDVADRLLADFKSTTFERDKYKTRVDLLEQKLELRAEELELSKRLRALAEEGEKRAVGALDAAVAGQRAAEADRDAWHRNRGLWFGAGVFVSVVAVVATAYAVR